MKGKFIWIAIGIAALLLFLLPAGGRTRAHADEKEEAERELGEIIEELVEELDTEQLQAFLDGLADFRGISLKEKLLSVMTGDFSLDYGSLLEAALGLVWRGG